LKSNPSDGLSGETFSRAQLQQILLSHQNWGTMLRHVRSQRMREAQNSYAQKLVLADRHIADGVRRAAEQRLLIARMRNRGLCTWEAEWLLREFEEILLEMSRHRQIIVAKLRDAA
jgi:hypothetical protein